MVTTRTVRSAARSCTRSFRSGAFVHVAMGTLVDGPAIRPSEHIFVGSKAPWFTITDDLPQYEEHAVAAGPAGE